MHLKPAENQYYSYQQALIDSVASVASAIGRQESTPGPAARECSLHLAKVLFFFGPAGDASTPTKDALGKLHQDCSKHAWARALENAPDLADRFAAVHVNPADHSRETKGARILAIFALQQEIAARIKGP